MKRIASLLLQSILIVASQTSCHTTHAVEEGGAPTTTVHTEIGFNDFYGALSPYGRWVEYGNYGRVWVCNDGGFIPYRSGGHWVYTDYGWTWVSDYNWGWAPFHYGRWNYDPAMGWMWLPGYEWAPAWVSWRSGGGYYGWAPLGPGWSVSATANFGTLPAEHWCFVPNRYMGHAQINNYYVNRTNNTTIINNTTVINNTYNINKTNFYSGPRREEVERYSGNKIQTMRVNAVNRPENGRLGKKDLALYKPDVKRPVNEPSVNNKPADNDPFKQQPGQGNRKEEVKRQNGNPEPTPPAKQPEVKQPMPDVRPVDPPKPAPKREPVNNNPAQDNDRKNKDPFDRQNKPQPTPPQNQGNRNRYNQPGGRPKPAGRNFPGGRQQDKQQNGKNGDGKGNGKRKGNG